MDTRALLDAAVAALNGKPRSEVEAQVAGHVDAAAILRAFDQAASEREAHEKRLATRKLISLQVEALLNGQPVPLQVRDADRLPPGWVPSGLCLAPCGVSSRCHPGLHKGDEPGEPVCALPAGHPEGGGHFCLPSDQTRYARCPTCGRLIAKRAIAGHIKAHDPANRKDRRALKAIAGHDVAAYLRAWVTSHPGPSEEVMWNKTTVGSYLENVAWHVEAGRWNPTGSYVRARINEANRRLGDRALRGAQVPPPLVVGLRATRKELARLAPTQG